MYGSVMTLKCMLQGDLAHGGAGQAEAVGFHAEHLPVADAGVEVFAPDDGFAGSGGSARRVIVTLTYQTGG
ncbi:MAG: hypothetical protein ACKOE2_01610 [Actinomycetales bacterium]